MEIALAVVLALLITIVATLRPASDLHGDRRVGPPASWRCPGWDRGRNAPLGMAASF